MDRLQQREVHADDSACFTWPRISDAAIERVVQLLRSGNTSYDLPLYEAFEAELARLFGVRHALCCTNGTSACYSAYRALGIGCGDTVIAPAITHWASVLPAVQCGARIAFADVQPDTCHLDPEAVRPLIDGATRAVVITHMFGEPLQLAVLRQLCDHYGLALIEDVSHAHGASYNQRPVGSFGDVSFCSFQKAKLVSAGEGGALLTNREELFYRAMELGHPRRLKHAPPTWQTVAGVGRGFKFRASPLLVVLAHESLRDLEDQNAVRRRACDELRSLLAASPYFAGLERPAAGRVYYHCELMLTPQLADRRDELVERLRRRGIRAHYVTGFLPGHPSLAGHLCGGGNWPVAEDVMRRVLLLEAFTAYSNSLIQHYGHTILKTLCDLTGE